MMQYFLARFRLYDGMHEYGGAFIVRAVTLEEAHTLATVDLLIEQVMFLDTAVPAVSGK